MVRAYLKPLDHLVKWAFVPYYAAACVIAALASGYIGSLLPGSHMVAIVILMLAAYYLWAAVIRKWCLGYFVHRANRLAPPLSTTVVADEKGIAFADEVSSVWMDWKAVREAKVVPEGVVLTYGMRGALIPARAFRDDEQRRTFVELVNASAKATAP